MATITRITMPDIEEVNKVVAFTDRVRRRKQEYLAAKPNICPERARLATESWKETEGEPVVIRRAKLFKKVMEGIPIVIREGEFVVGSQTKYIRGASPFVDFNPGAMLVQIEMARPTMTSEYVGAEISEEARRSVLEDIQYWKGKSVADRIREAREMVFGTIMEDIIEAKLLTRLEASPPQGRDANFEKVLKIGLKGIIAEAREELKRISHWDRDGVHKLHFLQAVIIALEGLIAFARRHSQLAREMAEKEGDAARKRELEQIAEVCNRVPENPARNFREAVQSFWFTLLGLNLEVAGAVETPGRFDQYMYPLYEKDIVSGGMTRQEAAELLGRLWVKFAEMESVKDTSYKERTQGSHFMNLTIGGVTPDGRDATNELSYLVLEVVRQVKIHQPHISLRYHDGLSEAFLIKAVETNRDIGAGIPQFLNDKVAILNMVKKGIPLEDARDWGGISCAFPYITHRSGSYGKPLYINVAKVFELALNNGIDPRTGKRLGPATGDPKGFSTFDELFDTFKRQFTHIVEVGSKAARISAIVRAENYPLPFNSALVDDCIKNGKDATAGGVRYPCLILGSVDRGHVNVANSLMAIKKLVFEEKKTTMDELLDAISVNFEGKEHLRQMLLSAPKYGNDNDEADAMMREVFTWTASVISRETNSLGYPLTLARHGVAWHYYAGKVTGALPDGRKAWTPLADGGVSPMTGTDTRGPTAVLNSASKLDNTLCDTTVLNQKFPPSVLQTREGIKKLLALIKTYFDRYGYHIQFNILDKQTLLDAKKHPENYRDLLVRVAGYSAHFVELAPELQDEIIARTEQTL